MDKEINIHADSYCVIMGTRTPVLALRGLRPRPLDDGGLSFGQVINCFAIVCLQSIFKNSTIQQIGNYLLHNCMPSIFFMKSPIQQISNQLPRNCLPSIYYYEITNSTNCTSTSCSADNRFAIISLYYNFCPGQDRLDLNSMSL